MNLKETYNSFDPLTYKKCSYACFCMRIHEWISPEKAILATRIYTKKTRTVKGIKEEIETLKKEMSQYRQQHDKYRELQQKKNRLLRILSVYKNK